MLEGVPQNLFIAGFCIWGVLQLLKAVKEFIPQRASAKALARSEVIYPEGTAPPAAPSAASTLNDSCLQRLDELRTEIRSDFVEVKSTLSAHAATMGDVRERLSRLEGAQEAGNTGRHPALG